MTRLLSLSLAALGSAGACSSWSMEKAFRLSGRTLDLTPDDFPFGIGVVVSPRGSEGALKQKVRLGHVGVFFLPNSSAPRTEDDFHARIATLNEKGLSCDEQHLNGSHFPQPSGDPHRDLSIHRFCEWAAGNFATVAAVKQALHNVTVYSDSGSGNHHYVVRDSAGAAVLVEATDGRELTLHDDLNDGGTTGFGVVTNSPPFAEQLQRMRARLQEATPASGGWHSDERFQRLALVKAALPVPRSLPAAIAQTFSVMDTVDTPAGKQRGQDWATEYTVVGFVRDHQAPAMYWRTAQNQQVQRLNLPDLGLDKEGAQRLFMSIAEPSLAWFHDAATALRPVALRRESV